MTSNRDVPFAAEDFTGGMSPGHVIEQVDKAIHPDGKNLILLLEKQRGDPGTKPQRDHILSRSIMRGRLNKDLGLPGDEVMNALEALMFADAINSIADQGQSRDELLQGVSSVQMFNRRNNRGGDNSGGDFAP